MCHRLLWGLAALSLLLPALLIAAERKYPPEMPTYGGKPFAFVKDREGNAVDGSWEHLARARERSKELGTIDVEVILFHEGFEQLEQNVRDFEGRTGAVASEARHQRVMAGQSFSSEYEALLDEFIASIEAIGFEAKVVGRSTLGPILYLRVDDSLLDILITHPMVWKVSDSGQMQIMLQRGKDSSSALTAAEIFLAASIR